jgi:hypothetical protein
MIGSGTGLQGFVPNNPWQKSLTCPLLERVQDYSLVRLNP